MDERPYVERYWNTIVPDNQESHDIWHARNAMQGNKQLADFNFKLLHKILPSQENLHKWKLSNTPQCRFGYGSTGGYQHMFVECQHLKGIISKLEKILEKWDLTQSSPIKCSSSDIKQRKRHTSLSIISYRKYLLQFTNTGCITTYMQTLIYGYWHT